jgi:hypothetical protein
MPGGISRLGWTIAAFPSARLQPPARHGTARHGTARHGAARHGIPLEMRTRNSKAGVGKRCAPNAVGAVAALPVDRSARA